MIPMENYCKPPKPTPSELKLRKILEKKQIPFKTDQVIWYTSCDCFTPDLIIGKRLIIEVDGKVHDKEHRKTLDRIRKRALENMDYTVRIVKNEQVRDKPNQIADEIKEMYYKLSDTAENKKKEETTITELKKPLEIKPIPKDIQFNLDFWATEFNKKLNDENWSVEFFRESLSKYHPELVKNQCAMEKLILVLHGLNLRKTLDDGVDSLDFEYSLKFFKKSLNLLQELFPDNGNMIAIHLKNIFNESAPGFFKNLIFKGGPNINAGIVSIKDKDSLTFHIDNFNKYLSEFGVTVEPSDIIQECKATLQKFSKEKKLNYNWLIEWIHAN
jgi:very-short-patch-repair endonuclease